MQRRLTVMFLLGIALLALVMSSVQWTPSFAQSGTIVPTFGPVIGGATVAPPQPTQAAPAAPVQSTTTPLAPPPNQPTVAAPTLAAPTAGAVLTATTTPLPLLNRDLMGIQAYGYVEEQTWRELMDRGYFMGMKWWKLQLSWKELEPVKGQYSAQFNQLRKYVFDLGKFRGAGYRVLLSIAKAPDWARPAAARGNADGPPANPKDLVDFVNHVLDTFDPEFVNAIEIWNEPNTAAEWTGAPISAASYMTIFKPAYDAIRAKSPNIIVITAGPAPTGGGAGALDDRVWLQQVYSIGLPIKDPNFAVGVHPYGWANAPDARCCAAQKQGWDDHPSFFFLDTLYNYREIMVKNQHSSGKLWATEFGWPSFEGLRVNSSTDGPLAMRPNEPGLGWMLKLTEKQQATYIIRAFEIAQTSDLAPYMGPMFIWNLNFASLPGYVTSDKPSNPKSAFSVLHTNTLPREAYNLLQRATGPK